MNDTLQTAQVAAVLVLLGLGALFLPRAYVRAVRLLAGGRNSAALAVALAVVAAAVLRWIVAPRWIATVFIGYELTAQAIALVPPSHYGVGAAALYHALFAFLPADHGTLLWANSVMGVLTVPLVAAFAGRLFADRRAGALAAWLVALVPLFVRNDNSDANNVPCLMWLFAGLVLWEERLAGGARITGVAAIALFSLAASSRPELPLLVPVLLALLTVALRPEWRRLRDPALVGAAIVGAALVLPHVVFVAGMVPTLEARSSLPGSDVTRAIHDLKYLDVVIDPRLFPVALPPLALVAVAAPSTRRAALLLLAAALVALVVYTPDLDPANMARVEVPAALLVTLAAAAGASVVVRRGGPVAAAALALAFAGSAVPTWRALWAPTNEQAEEDFLQDAIARLPPGPFSFVRVGERDRDPTGPGSFTHVWFPDYLLVPPRRAGDVSSIADFNPPADGRPAFFYQGMRCYARFRNKGTPPPPGDDLQPACASMHARFQLDPVIEHEVPNRGDVWMPLYGTAPTLHLALYRIRAPR